MDQTLLHVLLVALGAVVGAPLRFLAGQRWDGALPRGTMLVNVVGSLLLGVFSGLAVTGTTMALLGTGFCGALTTYSGFAVQTYDRGPRYGALTALLTVVPAVALCAAGFWLGASLR